MSFGEMSDRYRDKIRNNILPWIVIALTVICSGYMEVLATPAKRPFSLTDASIGYPFAVSQKYNDFMLFVTAVIVPFGVISLISFIDNSKTESIQTRFHHYYITTMKFFLSIGITIFLTTFLKIRLAKLRPDFLERCGPDISLKEIASNSSDTILLYDESICTMPLGRRLLDDGYKSCPSGHSSVAICGLGFLAIWLLQRYAYTTENSEDGNNVKKLNGSVWVLSCIPLLLALDIATSRIYDFRHAYWDIITGLIVGIIGLIAGFIAAVDDSNDHGLVLPL
ncbi:phosphatidate phosphatase [Martiniozyma asiatica (nom. inval.)]|nr:phosphatidate phosphatase [Martiniozyma asiatica]